MQQQQARRVALEDVRCQRVGGFGVSASYNLLFSDADVGAASSRFSFRGYAINLTGNVIRRPTPSGPAAIPAPGMLGLLSGGLLALGLVRRRRPL